MTEQLKTLDSELASAPSHGSFLFAVLTKYGIMGAVICFLGYSWIQKDEQQQKTTDRILVAFEKNTIATTQAVEVQKRMMDYLERQERR